MSEITLNLHASIGKMELISPAGGNADLPEKLRVGDVLRCKLRLYETDDLGQQTEVFPHVRALTAAIGRTLAPPDSGTFMLKNGPSGTPFGPIDTETTAEELKTMLNVAALGATCTEVELVYDLKSPPALVPGVWLVWFDSENALADIQAAENKLRPESFVRWRPFQVGDAWCHELRLIQAPLALSDAHARVLATQPSVRRIRAGGDEGNLSDLDVNEIQALTYPPGFVGTFVLRWGGRESRLLGIQDGPEEIAAALNGMWKDNVKRFAVTNPETNDAYIEFIGPLADTAQSLATVSVKTFAPGTLTFTLSLDTAQAHSAVRGASEIEVPLEIELEVVDNEADIANPAAPGRIITIAQQTVKVVREQIGAELAAIPSVDFLRPPVPRDYAKHTGDQVLIGNQATYVQAIGDGALRSFAIPHMRGTANGSISLRENSEGGRFLLPNEYTLRLGEDADNEFILDFPPELPPPALNAFVLCFTAAGPAGAYQVHTHTFDEVVVDDQPGALTLTEYFALLQDRVATLEELAPSAPPTLDDPDSQATEVTITLPDLSEVFPGRFAADFSPDEALTEGAGLARRAPALFPAIHDAAATSHDAGALPAASGHAGEVYLNNTGAAILLPGGLGWRSISVPHGEFAGSDGRQWYRVSRRDTSTSYYPTAAEREVIAPVAIDDRMLVPGGVLTLEAAIKLATLKADTRAHCVLVIELGTAPSQTTPATTAENLQDFIWNVAEPLFTQRLLLTPIAMSRKFGCRITRAANGTDFTADAMLDGRYTAGGLEPEATTFAIRTRLIQFDTENSVPSARGYVYYSLTGGKIVIN